MQCKMKTHIKAVHLSATTKKNLEIYFIFGKKLEIYRVSLSDVVFFWMNLQTDTIL